VFSSAGNGAHLLHHAEIIRLLPHFHDFATGHAKEIESRYFYRLAGSGNAKHIPRVNASAAPADQHQVALGDGLIMRIVEIRSNLPSCSISKWKRCANVLFCSDMMGSFLLIGKNFRFGQMLNMNVELP